MTDDNSYRREQYRQPDRLTDSFVNHLASAPTNLVSESLLDAMIFILLNNETTRQEFAIANGYAAEPLPKLKRDPK